MEPAKICDTCLYYYAYGLTNGACMLVLLSKKSRIDKDVSYTDSCDEWMLNEDLIKHKDLRYEYEELKKRYALEKLFKNNYDKK